MDINYKSYQVEEYEKRWTRSSKQTNEHFLETYIKSTVLDSNQKSIMSKIEQWYKNTKTLRFEQIVDIIALFEKSHMVNLIEVSDCSWRRCTLRLYRTYFHCTIDNYNELVSIEEAIERSIKENFDIFVFFFDEEPE